MLRNSNLADNRLEAATEKGDYEYWLTQEDIADIARLEYLNFRQNNEEDSFQAFDIIGSPEQLRNQLLSFKTRTEHINNARLILIVNLAQRHWVTLAITYHNKNYEGYYIDTLGKWLPENYQKSLENILISVTNLSGYFPGQTDGFNCGLWALENAEDLTRMIDEGKGAHWIVNQLQRYRSPMYFSERRRLLSAKLSSDPVRQERLSQTDQYIPVKETDNRLSPNPILPSTTADESNPKKIKLVTETEKVKEKLDLFVKFFIQSFAMRLGIYNLIAKGDRLTTEGLKTELKTGFVGALWGVTLAQNLLGSIPSVVASLRNVSAKYFTPKKKAQKLTKAFSEIKSSDLSEFLAEAAIEIFQSYEQQFMQVSDKAGYHTALDKLADDAAGRTLNYLNEKLTTTTISSEIIACGILQGKSETYFDPSLKKTRLRFTGNHIQNEKGHSFSTASLFEKVGLIIKSKSASPDIFYKKNIPQQSTLYGYRRPLSWELDTTGMLKASEQNNYISENPSDLIAYDYQLNSINAQQEVAQVLQRISISEVVTPRKTVPAKNIIFNLRHPLKNFSGRSQALITLHQLLGSGSKPTVVTQMAQLSLSPADRPEQSLQEGTQTAVSGLGGIGKTQLALQYAKQHAADYDHNVLWIDSEKKVDIVDSFKKLAIKLAIDLNDAYGIEKENSQLIEEVYDYFSTAKSLFIFDNVENTKEIKDILPKASSGNKPTVLITSRYSNWKNIATPLHLSVFTEAEARIFIKTELSIMGNAENAQITELANLLQSLPLALQQALAYINSEKVLDSSFSIQHYINRFKQKQRSQELLDFDISQYNNDPYSKTILTTWEITLEKIKQNKLIGSKAIETIQIMAYLYPDNILNSIFFQLPNNVRLSSAIHLLKAYSLINEGSEPNISTIHRLVQKVLRIKLESNRSEFEKIIQNIIYLTADATKNKETMSHYFSFLLHMLEHKELTRTFDLAVTHRKIIESLTYYEKDKNLLNDLFDFADTILPRENYLEFIGEALVIYTHYPFIVALSNVLDYIDKKIYEKLISLEEAKLILDFKYTITSENYKKVRLSVVPAQRAAQFNAIILIYAFEHKHFWNDRTRICRQKRERKRKSINTLCALTEDERSLERPLDVQQIKTYIEKIRLVTNLANLALLSKDTLSALIQGDFESVAISFALLSSSRILGKISNNLLIKGEEQLAFGDEKLLLKKELDYDAKLATSLLTDKEIMLTAKRRFLGSAMKAAAPFVARGGSILYFAYNLVKGLNSNQTDLLDNFSNAAIIALDVGESGIEAIESLGYIAKVSGFIVPLGEGLGFLIIVGSQLYHVEKELRAIEKWVHLSGREKFVEGIRSFFNFQPSEYLETKANNNQLINKAIDFLKLHPEIQRYVFSAWLPATTLAKKNFVFLDQKRNLTLLTDDIPQEPKEGYLFCLAGTRSPSYSKDMPWIEKQLESFVEAELESLLGLEERTLHLCINAIGVEYTSNRTGNATLIALQGNATVIGAHSDTIFLINNGNHHYWAGDADDLFILQGTHITGKLQGGLGVNILKFSDYQPNERVLLDPFGFLCVKNTTTNKENFFFRTLRLSNFTQVHDKFSIVGIMIDTYVEKNVVKLDYIYITKEPSKNLNTTVKPNTVYFLPDNTTDIIVIYKVPADQIGSTYMQLSSSLEGSYQFYEEFCVEGLQLNNITQLHGRKNKQDTIFTIEGITVVDTYAGENADKPDTIYITEQSSKNLNIVLRPDTVVHSFPRNTTDNRVIYKIPMEQIGNAYVRLPFNDETIHQFYFESALDELETLSIKNNTIFFQLSYPDGCFNLTIQNTDALLPTNNATIAKPFFILSASYLFNKNLEVKLVNENTLYSQWHGNHRVDKIIQAVAPMAHRIDKAILIQTPQNQTIAIGSRQQEILSTDGLIVNHLVGNGGDTVYVIQIPKNRTDPFPLNDISLYNLENNTLATKTMTDTLDLREVVKKAQNQCSARRIFPDIEENDKDLTLTLYTNYYFSVPAGCIPLASWFPLLKILLKNALNNYWYQDLDIILDEHPLTIIYDEGNWKVVRISAAFTKDKNIIVITDADIKKDDEFFILKNAAQYDFIHHNATDLLLTNLFNNVTATELYTVLFSNFFQNSLFKEKVLSLSLSFLDESFTINEHTQEINNAKDFYLLIKAYFNTSQIFLNQSGLFFTDVTTQPTSRKRRDITTPAPISSASSKITPDVYNLFTYLPLQMLKFVSFMLTRFKFTNDFDVNPPEKKSAASKTKRSITLPKEKLNLPVHCNKNNIFTKENCWKNESPLGLLGYCANSKQEIAWFIKNTDEITIPKLSWFAITDNGITTNTSTNYLNTQASRLSLQTDHLHFSPQDGCQQVINLDKMSNTTLTALFPYLPLEGKQWLLAEWRHKKNGQDKLLQDEIALSLFKQQSLQVGLNYLGNIGLLHTFIGDYFQALHLKPDWREHDPSYFLARWLSAIQQLRLGGTRQTSTVAAALLETALLHPKIQAGYSFLWPNTKIRYKKQALRFCADLLQWGNLNFALIPSLLEILFTDYLPIESITWGLRVALSFYSINNDPSYYYLGIALFLLPQLPLLLEHLGIPVTAYVSKALEKLTQLLIFQSLLEQLKPIPDQSRLEQRNIELQAAEQRVSKGRTRVAMAVKPLVSFFKPPSVNKQGVNHPESEKSASKSTYIKGNQNLVFHSYG